MVRFYERTQEWLQERARPFVIAIVVIVSAVVLYLAGTYFFDYRRTHAEAAFAEALEKFNARVQDSTVATTAPATLKTYPDEQTKWKESAEAFEKLASEYSGYYGSIGRYYAGVSYLHIERDKGVGLLEQVAATNDKPTSDLARLALAENFNSNSEYDKAISLYQQLLGQSDSLRPAIQLGLGRAYEKSGDAQKAAEAYFEAAKLDRSSPVGLEAEACLKRVDPSRIKDLPVPESMPIQP
jgi:hypothetical protein